jgi:hypothetical protein
VEKIKININSLIAKTAGHLEEIVSKGIYIHILEGFLFFFENMDEI